MGERMRNSYDDNYEYLAKPRCPYCGEVLDCWSEIFSSGSEEIGDGAQPEYTCSCGKDFMVNVSVTYDFSTLFPDDLEEDFS